VHYLEILGEAAARLSNEFRDRHPDIPWFKIIGMRNILVHDYFHIDPEAVWSAVTKDLPVIEQRINQLL